MKFESLRMLFQRNNDVPKIFQMVVEKILMSHTKLVNFQLDSKKFFYHGGLIPSEEPYFAKH